MMSDINQKSKYGLDIYEKKPITPNIIPTKTERQPSIIENLPESVPRYNIDNQKNSNYILYTNNNDNI